MKLSTYHLAVPVDGGTHFLLHSFVSGGFFKVSADLYACLQDQNWNSIPAEIMETLKSYRIVVEDNNELYDSGELTDTLYVALLPNSKCNLSCKYCGQRKLGHTMSDATQKMTLDLIRESLKGGDYKHLKISWFGGEPTLSLEVVHRMSLSLIAMAEEQGCTYSSEMVTNGIALSRATCDVFVKECQICRFEITLDGYQDNERRVNSAGKGFYNEIVTNILYLVTLPCSVTIRCNVDRYNKEKILPMLTHFKRLGLHNKVDFYLAMIHSWGCESGNSAMEATDFAKFQISVYEFMLENGFRLSAESLLPHREHTRQCMMQQGESSFLVDAYGLIYSCSEEPYTRAPETIMGHVSIGRKQSTPLFTLSDEQKYKCTSCKIWPVCGGGCLKRYCEHGEPECMSLLYNMEERVLLVYKLIKLAQNNA